MTIRNTFLSTLGILLAAAVSAVAQQAPAVPATQQAPAATAAQKANEQEKGPSKAAKVFTNDDIANLKGSVSVVGPDAPADEKAKSAAAADATEKPVAEAKAEAKDEASWRKKFAEARKTLADDSKELDVLQREYNLKQIQFYSDPNVAMREQNSRKDLDDTLQQINTKKDAVANDKQAVSNLEDDLRKAGGDPGWASEPESASSEPTKEPTAEASSEPTSEEQPPQPQQ